MQILEREEKAPVMDLSGMGCPFTTNTSSDEDVLIRAMEASTYSTRRKTKPAQEAFLLTESFLSVLVVFVFSSLSVYSFPIFATSNNSKPDSNTPDNPEKAEAKSRKAKKSLNIIHRIFTFINIQFYVCRCYYSQRYCSPVSHRQFLTASASMICPEPASRD